MKGDIRWNTPTAFVRHTCPHGYRYAMASMMQPRGPRPNSVYWRRRLVVLVAVVAILLFLVWLIFSGLSTASAEGDEGGEGQPSTPASSPSATPSESTAPSDQPSDGPSESPSPDASAQANSTPDCRDSDITVTVATDKDAYPSGINPQITMTIASKAQADCVRDIGSSANEIKITSGDQNVWSSNDCDSSQASSRQVLTPGARAEVKPHGTAS